MYDSHIIIEHIKDGLKAKGSSANAMVNELGYGQNLMQQIANGSNGIGAKKLFGIAEYLGVSVDWLLGRTDNRESHKEKSNSNAIVGSTVSMTNSNAGHDNSYITSENKYDEMLEKLIHIYNQLDFRNRVMMLSMILEKWDV